MTANNPEATRIERFERLEKLPFATTGQSRKATSVFAEIRQFRSLLRRLTLREIKSKYKDSALGVVWVLIPPVVQLAIYYFAIGKVLGASRSVPEFAVFVFTGLIFWTFFSESINSLTGSLAANSGLIKKVYLPREIFPLASLGTTGFNFLVQFVVLIVATVLIGNWSYGADLALAPLALAILLVYSSALGLILSAATIFYRDLQHLVGIALQLMFWASPIVYPYTFVANTLNGNIWNDVYLANPITIAIIGAQKALWVEGSVATGVFEQAWPADLAARMAIALAAGLVLLLISHRVFRRLQANLAQEL